MQVQLAITPPKLGPDNSKLAKALLVQISLSLIGETCTPGFHGNRCYGYIELRLFEQCSLSYSFKCWPNLTLLFQLFKVIKEDNICEIEVLFFSKHSVF